MTRTILLFLVSTLPAAALDYKRDIMPIFEERCYDCHSEEAGKVKGGLKLDDEKHFADRFAENDVVVPGDWDASYLFVTLVLARDKKGAMPPKNKGDSLSEKEVRLVAQWIHEGAEINGKKGEKGPDEWDPSKTLNFKNGQIVMEQFGEAPPEPAEVKEPVWQAWTNQKGKEIIAHFQGVKNGKALFLLKSGKKTDYPLNDLSEESQQRIRALSASMEKMMQ